MAVVILCLSAPVAAGLAGTILPAFGYLPAIGAMSFSLDPVRAVLSAPGMMTSLALSLLTGLAATLISLALVLLFTASWIGTRVFGFISRFLSPLLSVPHAAAAFGLAFLIAPSGFVVRLFSPWATGWDRPPDLLILNDPYGLAMTAGLIVKEVPFLFLMTLAAIPQTRVPQMMKATANLGIGRIWGFLMVSVPQIYPQIRLPVLAVLAYSTSVVDVAMILGPTTPAPLAPRILVWLSDPDPAVRLQASAAAVIQVLLTGFAILLWIGGERLTGWVVRRLARRGLRMSKDRAVRQIAFALIGALIAVTGAGLAIVGLWSVAKGWWFPDAWPSRITLSLWRDAFAQNSQSVSGTFVIGAIATIVCTVLVLWLLEAFIREHRHPGKGLRGMLFLPLLVPQISFLFGLQVLFVIAGLDGTMAAVILAHGVFVLPYVFLALSDPWRHLDPRYTRVAAALGVSNNRIFWTVRLPMLLHPILVAGAIGFAVSIGQYLPTVMIGAGRITTVTSESIALASGGNRSLLAVYAVLQLIMPLIAFTLASAIPALVHRNRSGLRGLAHH